MRLMGIDYGEKKIGIALSDESAKIAFPHSVIKNVSVATAIKEIKKICEEKQVGKIILGKSLDYKNQPNIIMAKIEKFKSLFEKEISLSVEFENEVLTTKQAERYTGKQPYTHASAAALILQSYLDKTNSQNRV